MEDHLWFAYCLTTSPRSFTVRPTPPYPVGFFKTKMSTTQLILVSEPYYSFMFYAIFNANT